MKNGNYLKEEIISGKDTHSHKPKSINTNYDIG